MKPALVLLLVASACSQRSSEPPEPPHNFIVGGPCSFREVETRCRLADVSTGRANSDDVDAVALTVRYEALPSDGGPWLAPWAKTYTLPSPRVAPVTEHYRAHPEVACVAQVQVNGSCTPDSHVLEVPSPSRRSSRRTPRSRASSSQHPAHPPSR